MMLDSSIRPKPLVGLKFNSRRFRGIKENTIMTKIFNFDNSKFTEALETINTTVKEFYKPETFTKLADTYKANVEKAFKPETYSELAETYKTTMEPFYKVETYQNAWKDMPTTLKEVSDKSLATWNKAIEVNNTIFTEASKNLTIVAEQAAQRIGNFYKKF